MCTLVKMSYTFKRHLPSKGVVYRNAPFSLEIAQP